MNIFKLILEECNDDERKLVSPHLHQVEEANALLPEQNIYARCLQSAKTREETHYERRAEALERHFALNGRDKPINYGFAGWWDARGCGPVPFRDFPEYRFRGKDLEIDAALVARDRAEEKKESLQKRQSAWRRAQRDMRSNWTSALTRSLKSG